MKVISLILAALVLAGCSSIISKTDYSVAVNSDPDGAHFVITNKAGQKVHSGRTPSTVTLKSSAGFFQGETYAVTLRKDGYPAKTFTIASSIDGWYFGNIIFGGVLGMLIVDPATGAMFNLPERVDVSLDRSVSSTSEASLKIATLDSLSMRDIARLQPIQ